MDVVGIGVIDDDDDGIELASGVVVGIALVLGVVVGIILALGVSVGTVLSLNVGVAVIVALGLDDDVGPGMGHVSVDTSGKSCLERQSVR